jgi:PmbA protein
MIIFENNKLINDNFINRLIDDNIININLTNKKFEEIYNILIKEKEIKEFMFSINNSVNFYFGVNNNNIGSVYSPLSFSEEFSGVLTIIWNNNKLSLVDLDNDKILNFEKYINFFKEISYEEKFLPELSKDAKHIDFKSFDIDLYEEIKNNNFELFIKSYDLFKYFKDQNVKFSNIDVNYSFNYEIFANSNGLNFGKIYTENSIFYDFDSILGYSKGKYKKLEENDIDEFKTYFKIFFDKFNDVEYKKIETKNVILLSPVLYSLLNFYLGYNFDGKNLYYKKSFFSIDDFENNRIFSSKPFTLYFDPTIDFEFSSYPISVEGLTPAKTIFIEDGKLIQPSISLKSSKMLNKPANNGFGGGKLILSPYDKTLLSKIEELEDCYIVFDILGLHTQDPISGNFSLSVSTGLLKEKGKFVGLMKGNIASNIFEIFKSGNFEILKNDYNEKFSLFTKINVVN